MFCPKCGKGEQTPNAYCRNCGEFLRDFIKINKFIFGGTTIVENIRISAILSLITAVCCLVLVVSLYVTFTNQLNPSRIIFMTGAFLIAMFVWQLTSLYIAFKMRRKFLHRQCKDNLTSQITMSSNSPQNILPPADTAKIVRPPVSVTENSTELLQTLIPKQKQNL